MTRKAIIENKEYTEILFKILNGKTKPRDMIKVDSGKTIYDKHKDMRNLSHNLSQLTKQKFIRKEKGIYSINYIGVLKYIDKTFFYNHYLKSLGKETEQLINYLETYFNKVNANYQKYKEEISLKELLEQLIIEFALIDREKVTILPRFRLACYSYLKFKVSPTNHYKGLAVRSLT